MSPGRRRNHRDAEAQRKQTNRKEGKKAGLQARSWLETAFSFFGFLCFSLCLCASVVPSSTFAKGVDAGSIADVQDVLFFPEGRPVLIRLHILVDGKPYGDRWQGYLMRWFHFLDRNEDGFLDRKEADRAPADRLLQELFGNPFTYRTMSAPDFEELDRDHDKKVSLTEFLHHYRQSPAGPVSIAAELKLSLPGLSYNVLTEALYTLLDQDHDARLSQSELENAEKTLRKFK